MFHQQLDRQAHRRDQEDVHLGHESPRLSDALRTRMSQNVWKKNLSSQSQTLKLLFHLWPLGIFNLNANILFLQYKLFYR